MGYHTRWIKKLICENCRRPAALEVVDEDGKVVGMYCRDCARLVVQGEKEQNAARRTP